MVRRRTRGIDANPHGLLEPELNRRPSRVTPCYLGSEPDRIQTRGHKRPDREPEWVVIASTNRIPMVDNWWIDARWRAKCAPCGRRITLSYGLFSVELTGLCSNPQSPLFFLIKG